MDECPAAEIHQVGNQMIHLARERIENSEEYLGLIEGGGICLANSFPTAEEADGWLQRMFARLYTKHTCALGCMKMPGSQFLCNDFELERMLKIEDPRLP
jgi:hypothetical protein